MLQRLMAWCVPESALELRAAEPTRADLGEALAPYESGASVADAPIGLRVVGNS